MELKVATFLRTPAGSTAVWYVAQTSIECRNKLKPKHTITYCIPTMPKFTGLCWKRDWFLKERLQPANRTNKALNRTQSGVLLHMDQSIPSITFLFLLSPMIPIWSRRLQIQSQPKRPRPQSGFQSPPQLRLAQCMHCTHLS